MKAFIIQETAYSPSVVLNPQQNRFEITGASRPENAVQFYTPILNWLSDFGKSESRSALKITFYFDYLNSISVKIIFDFFKILEGLNSFDKPIAVIWYYNSGDIDMKETGEEYQKLLKLPFSIIAKESKKK